MSIHHIEPGFTGTVSSCEAAEVIQKLIAFRVNITVCEDVTEGKVTRTFYDWRVTLLGNDIARRSVYQNEYPKTRSAAKYAASKAIRNYCNFVLTNIHKR